MLKDYYYTDKEELDALRKENEELKVKLKDYSIIIENLRDDVITYRSMYDGLKNDVNKELKINQKRGGTTNGSKEN